MEKLGYHKRDLLVSRVQQARDSQQAAKAQFQVGVVAVRGMEAGVAQDNHALFNLANEPLIAPR